MFVGNVNIKIDEKGRVPFPAVFRKLLKDGALLIASKDLYEKCIKIQTQDSWKEEEIRFSSRLNEFNKEHRQLRRQFTLNVYQLNLDASGRILLPKALLEFCEIKKEVAFMGNVGSIEVWSRENSESLVMSASEYAKSMNQILGHVANDSNNSEFR